MSEPLDHDCLVDEWCEGIRRGQPAGALRYQIAMMAQLVASGAPLSAEERREYRQRGLAAAEIAVAAPPKPEEQQAALTELTALTWPFVSRARAELIAEGWMPKATAEQQAQEYWGNPERRLRALDEIWLAIERSAA